MCYLLKTNKLDAANWIESDLLEQLSIELN